MFTAILSTAPLISGVAAAGGALATFGARAATIGAGLTTALTLPIAAVGAAMISQSLKIEDAWNEVRATYNATPAEINKLVAPTGLLGKAVTDLSLKYGLARDEVIGLLGKLSQMGYTGKDATDTLTQGLEFAVAAGLKLEDGLNLSIAIVNTFGLKGKNLTETLRGLNVVENDTAASGFDLMKALTRAGGAAQAMTGPTFTSTDAVASLAAGMAVLKANGQETARSADALRAIFQRIYTPTDQVQALFDKMGVSLHNAKGEIVPFPDLLQKLADNFHKLTPYEQMQFGKKSIGVEFGPLFRTLIADVQKGADGMSIYNNTLKEFGDTSKGAAAYANELKIRQESLHVALGQVKAAFGLLVDTMRPALVSVIKPLAGGIAAFAKWLSKTSPQAQKFAVIMGLVIAVIGPLVLLIGGLVAVFAAIGWEVAAVVAIIAGLVVAFIAIMKRGGPLASFLKGAFSIIWANIRGGVMDLIDALKNLVPYFKVVGAILGGSLIGILIVLSAAFRGVAFIIKWVAWVVGWVFKGIIAAAMWLYDVLVGHSIIPDLINAIIFYFNLLWAVIGPVVETFVKLVVIAFQTMWDLIVAAFNIAVALFTAAWNILVTVITGVINTIVSIVTNGFNILVAIITLVWQTVSTVIMAALNIILAVITMVVGQIVNVFKFAWDIIVATVTFVWNVIKTTINTVLGIIRGLVNVFMGLITGDWQRAWQGIVQIGTAIWNGIKGLWNAFWTFMKSTGTAALNFLKSTWNTIWTAIKSIGSTIWNAIKSLWNSFWTAMKSIGQSALNIIKTVVTSFINNIKSIISNGLNAAKSVWSNGWNAFKSIVNGVVNSIKAIINGIVSVVNNVVGKVSGALSKIKSGAGKVKDFFGFSHGGLVPGTGTGDTVPSMLTPGEFVVTKRAVKRIGVANLTRLNRGAGGAAVLGAEASGGTGTAVPQTARTLVERASARISQARKTVASNLEAAVPTASANELQAKTTNVQYNFQTAVYNPVAEKASDSVQRRVTRLADMGMFASAGKD